MIKLVPQDGARVRDPKSKLIVGPEGVEIAKLSTYWFKRLQEGSMIEAPKEKQKEKEKVSTKVSKDKGEK